jgi:hypothetical protein
VREPATDQALEWYRQDSALLVWCLSSTEVISALQRRFREGGVTESTLLVAAERLEFLRQDWLEVSVVRPVRDRAERLLAVHALRAADSLQLAAALVATEELPRGVFFLSFDSQLRQAAQKEGFCTP